MKVPVYYRLILAEDRYQRENQMGKYSLPNTDISGREAAQPKEKNAE